MQELQSILICDAEINCNMTYLCQPFTFCFLCPNKIHMFYFNAMPLTFGSILMKNCLLRLLVPVVTSHVSGKGHVFGPMIPIHVCLSVCALQAELWDLFQSNYMWPLPVQDLCLFVCHREPLGQATGMSSNLILLQMSSIDFCKNKTQGPFSS